MVMVGTSFEAQFARHFGPGLTPSSPDEPGYDFATRDGRHLIEVKQSLLGARDMQAAVMKLAIHLAESGSKESWAHLVARFPRMSGARLAEEWRRAILPLKPRVAGRMGLVAVAAGEAIVIPIDDFQKQLHQALRATSGAAVQQKSGHRWTPKTFAVWRVLFDAWLVDEASLSLQEVARRSLASSWSVRAALAALKDNGELAKGFGRSVRLASFPRQSLREVATLSNTLRERRGYVDASGRPPNVEALLERLRTRAPAGVMIGGVVSARQYDPSFDLNGVPRIDVTLAPDVPTDWLRRVDAALQPTSGDAMPVLVTHRLQGTLRDPSAALASPAETILDLYEMNLVEQADDLTRVLRDRHALE